MDIYTLQKKIIIDFLLLLLLLLCDYIINIVADFEMIASLICKYIY